MAAEPPAVDLPPAVTFQTGAQLLVQLGIVDHITHQGVRHIADQEEATWPFGDDKDHRYWTLAGATVMATGPFLEFFEEYFRKHPRGSHVKPRSRR